MAAHRLDAQWWLEQTSTKARTIISGFSRLRSVAESGEPIFPAYLSVEGPFPSFESPSQVSEALATYNKPFSEMPRFGSDNAASSWHIAILEAWSILCQRLRSHSASGSTDNVLYLFPEGLLELAEGREWHRAVIETHSEKPSSAHVAMLKSEYAHAATVIRPVSLQESCVAIAATVLDRIIEVKTLMRSIDLAAEAKDPAVMERYWPTVRPFVMDWLESFWGEWSWSTILLELPDSVFPGPLTKSVRKAVLDVRERISKFIPETQEIPGLPAPDAATTGRWELALRTELPERRKLWAEWAATLSDGAQPSNIEQNASPRAEAGAVSVEDAIRPLTAGQKKLVRYLWDSKYPKSFNDVWQESGTWDRDKVVSDAAIEKAVKRIREKWFTNGIYDLTLVISDRTLHLLRPGKGS